MGGKGERRKRGGGGRGEEMFESIFHYFYTSASIYITGIFFLIACKVATVKLKRESVLGKCFVYSSIHIYGNGTYWILFIHIVNRM